MGFLGVKIARVLVFFGLGTASFSSYFLEILVLQTGFEIIGYTRSSILPSESRSPKICHTL